MEVKLKKRHKHAGKWHEAGETIDVDAVTANWLAQHDVIEKPTVERHRRNFKTDIQPDINTKESE